MNKITETARKYLGIREVKGPNTHPTIQGWLIKLGAWYRDDEAPWCGTFCAAVMAETGYSYPKMYMRALDWAAWGYKCTQPIEGCVAVKTRKGGGHVTIVIGRDRHGNLLCLGGNQGDAVSIVKYQDKDFVAFRAARLPSYVPLPVLTDTGETAGSEA